ncbi:MAG: hypothetical protein ACRCYS_09325 [Beijerinckiaceae bacterium]
MSKVSGDRLALLYLSASVQRWHQNPALARSGQTNGDHQGRCVLLLLALHPNPSVPLLRALAGHDVGELVAGDLKRPFKQENPTLAGLHADAEKVARESIFGADWRLTDDEMAWVGLIDWLEAHCWCLHVAPGEYHRPGSGWLADEVALFSTAAVLGCEVPVRGLIHDLKSGEW